MKIHSQTSKTKTIKTVEISVEQMVKELRACKAYEMTPHYADLSAVCWCILPGTGRSVDGLTDCWSYNVLEAAWGAGGMS